MNDTYFYIPDAKKERLVKVTLENGKKPLSVVTDGFVNYLSPMVPTIQEEQD